MNKSKEETSGKEYLKEQCKDNKDMSGFVDGTPKICADECVGVIEICDEKNCLCE